MGKSGQFRDLFKVKTAHEPNYWPLNFSVIFSCLILLSCTGQPGLGLEQPPLLEDGIQVSTAREVGLDPAMLQQMEDSIEAGRYSNIHSVLILRHNRLVYEKYWPGHDQDRIRNWAGLAVHHRDSLHDIRSITKSITGAAVLIALEQGAIKSLDQKVFDFFPDLADYGEGKKKEITLKHLLTMTSGLHWQESDNDSLKQRNVAYAMDYILRQPLVSDPGTVFRYSSASTQLLAQILEKSTGLDIEAFTAKYLLGPLGITAYEWTREDNGLISAWAGLRMRSRDLLKFGMLYLGGGAWNNQAIIPPHLVEESVRTHVTSGESVGYGYQFWTLADTVKGQPIHTFEAAGNGGQKIEINRVEALIMVVTAGNYDQADLPKSPYDLYLDFVCPAILD